MPTKRAVLYLRVSTTDQHTSNQEAELRQIAERADWEVVKVYRDHGISGAKGRDKRPAFDALCRDASRRQFDVVMAWSVDRLGRSLQDLVNFLSDSRLEGGSVPQDAGGRHDYTGGKAMFQLMGSSPNSSGRLFKSASAPALGGPEARESSSVGQDLRPILRRASPRH